MMQMRLLGNVFRNKTNTVIKKAQDNYYKKILDSNNNSSKQLWKTFGNILNKNKKSHKRIVNINIDNTVINQKISESFNDFFCKIGSNLANKFSNNNNEEYKIYLNNLANQSLFLYKVNQNEVDNAISNLKNSNSSGYDEIIATFVKLSTQILIPALV